MTFVIVGLGNPGKEYENTRHNTGRLVLEEFRRQNDISESKADMKRNALVSSGTVVDPITEKMSKSGVLLIEPETFMNKSGESLKSSPEIKLKSKNKILVAENLAVIHDDLDIPFGAYKISFNKSSGGHKGVESVMRALKTEAFVRIRVGICPVTPSGKTKKPHGEVAVEKLILGKFSSNEFATLKKLSKKISQALSAMAIYGKDRAMSQFNG